MGVEQGLGRWCRPSKKWRSGEGVRRRCRHPVGLAIRAATVALTALTILVKQSPRPLNWRVSPCPMSAARRVRAKSSGYTARSDVAPAAPPAARLPAKYRQNCVFLSTPSRNMTLYLSLNAKLSACVGKYRSTFAQLPRHSARAPSSRVMRRRPAVCDKRARRREPWVAWCKPAVTESELSRGGEGGDSLRNRTLASRLPQRGLTARTGAGTGQRGSLLPHFPDTVSPPRPWHGPGLTVYSTVVALIHRNLCGIDRLNLEHQLYAL
jgi:hypothetical protein